MLDEIAAHVQKFPKPVRAQILAFLLAHRERIVELASQYPLEIHHHGFGGYRIVVWQHDNHGFHHDGWVTALWESL